MAATLVLRTLGGLFIEKEGAPLSGAAARRRPLALLAHVAASGDAGISRELALARFWPDSDEAKARNNLKQAVFGLRRDLGDVFASGAATLRIDRSVIAVDALDFAEALQRGDPDAAIEIYRGPFLDGFSVPDLDEFERWVEEQRQRLAGLCHRALESMAENARRSGDLAAAVEAWRRRTAMDPLSGRATAGLMRALRDVGDHTAALDLLRVHEILVRDELGATPDPALVALAAEIRRGFSLPPAPATASRPQTSPTPAVATPHVPVPAAPADESPAYAEPALAGPTAPQRTGQLDRLRQLWARVPSPRATLADWPRDAMMIAVAVAAPFITWRLAARPPASSGTVGVPSLVAVLPFAVRADPTDSVRLGFGVADLVAVALNGADRFRTVPPSTLMPGVASSARDGFTPASAASAAKRYGASEFVIGEIVREGTRVHVAASLHRTDRAALLASAATDGPADELDAAVDRLVIALVAQRLVGPGHALSHVAATSTSSLPALKAWLAGEENFGEHRYADAAADFQRASALDPTFAVAFYRLATAADLLGDATRADSAAGRAFALADRLPAAERELLAGWRDWRTGAVQAAEDRLTALVEGDPQNVDGWFQLAELRFHSNPRRGRSVREARAAFEKVIALEPEHAEALLYLARIASLDGRMTQADEYVRRARAASTDGHGLELRAARTFAIGEGPLQQRALGVLLQRPSGPSASALDVAVYRDDIDGTAAFARTLLASATSRPTRALAFRLTALTSIAHARWHVADSALDSLETLDDTPGRWMRALLVAQPFLQADTSELHKAALSVARPAADTGPAGTEARTLDAVRHHRLGLLADARGDRGALGRERDVLRTLAREPDTRALASALEASLAARAARRDGRLADALRALDGATFRPTRAAVAATEVADRFLRAEILHQLGRDDEALGWYGSMAERASYELPWLAPSQLRLAQIYDARGQAGLARRHYLRFLTLWQDCDPPLRATTADAARAVARLGAPATGH